MILWVDNLTSRFWWITLPFSTILLHLRVLYREMDRCNYKRCNSNVVVNPFCQAQAAFIMWNSEVRKLAPELLLFFLYQNLQEAWKIRRFKILLSCVGCLCLWWKNSFWSRPWVLFLTGGSTSCGYLLAQFWLYTIFVILFIFCFHFLSAKFQIY